MSQTLPSWLVTTRQPGDGSTLGRFVCVTFQTCGWAGQESFLQKALNTGLKMLFFFFFFTSSSNKI